MAAREWLSRSVIEVVVSARAMLKVGVSRRTRRSGGAPDKYSRFGEQGAWKGVRLSDADERFRRSGEEARDDPAVAGLVPAGSKGKEFGTGTSDAEGICREAGHDDVLCAWGAAWGRMGGVRTGRAG